MASIGKITGVNGNLIRVKFESAVSQNEVAYAKLISKNEAGKTEIIPLKSEVIRIRGDYAELQVFEDTTGLKAGDEVEFTGELLSVELGPGLLTQVFDGLQNPLPKLADECGFFLQRGKYLKALPRLLLRSLRLAMLLLLVIRSVRFRKVFSRTASWCRSSSLASGLWITSRLPVTALSKMLSQSSRTIRANLLT